MKLRKSLLRACARAAIEERGFTVDLVRGAGILPGARLRAKKGTLKRNIAVRTSVDREVGLTRNSDGSWATILRVDEVLVAVPSAEEPGSAEILSFAPNVLVRAFDAVLKARQSENPNFSLKAPIFVALDEATQRGSANVEPSLKAKSQWTALVPLTAVSRLRLSQNESEDEFFDRIRREFAERHGFDASKVTVKFEVGS
jgi:hypothetical protein